MKIDQLDSLTNDVVERRPEHPGHRRHLPDPATEHAKHPVS